MATLSRLIAEATEALTRLDTASLEELGQRAEAMAALNLGSAGVSGAASVPVLEQRFRLFAALLKATGDNLASLRRAEAQESLSFPYGDRSSGRQGLRASEALPLDGYGASRGLPPRGLFESFGLYSEEDAADSIWPRGRMAQARARREASSAKLPGGSRMGRA